LSSKQIIRFVIICLIHSSDYMQLNWMFSIILQISCMQWRF